MALISKSACDVTFYVISYMWPLFTTSRYPGAACRERAVNILRMDRSGVQMILLTLWNFLDGFFGGAAQSNKLDLLFAKSNAIDVAALARYDQAIARKIYQPLIA